MLDLSQVRHSLLQSLENYQRCGVRRIPRSSVEAIPAELLEMIEQMRSPTFQATVSKETIESASSESQETSSQSTQVREHRVQRDANVSDSRVESKSEHELVAERPWSLPQLDQAERKSRLDQINDEVRACRKCSDIVCYRQQTVFGVGPLQPTICFMGEAPGADEDRVGQPFVGRAGQLLTKIIEAMQLAREEVFILNALKCRPPQNRTPVPEEIEQCHPYVEAQLEILQPKFIVCLGAVAVRSLLGLTLPVGSLRGRFHQYRQARVVITYHPSYLLRNESAKKLVWQDMQMLMQELGIKLPEKNK